MMVRRYAAAFILVGMALFFNALHFILEVLVEPRSGTMGYWLNTTVENLQSEFWQVAAAAFVFQHWQWANSPESSQNAPNTPWAIVVPLAVIALFLVLWGSLRGEMIP